MASKVLLRVVAMLVCVASANALVAAYVAAELEASMAMWSDEQAAPLFGILFRGGLLAAVMLAGALWKLWLFPPGSRLPQRTEQPTAQENVTG